MTEKKRRTDFRRFWAVFNRLRIRGDREDCRRQIVSQYTKGRTDSLKEMTEKEYRECIAGMEALFGTNEDLRKLRSSCLKLMQQMGVDTTDWNRVDALCMDRRIAGKKFAWLDIHELEDLRKKLRAIKNKGGLRTMKDAECTVSDLLIVPARQFEG